MARRKPAPKNHLFRARRAAPPRNPVIASTFDVGRRFRCTMRVCCRQLDPGAVIRPIRGERHPRMSGRLDEAELADWHAGRDAVSGRTAPTIGARRALTGG
jgi:hypothetical protein